MAAPAAPASSAAAPETALQKLARRPFTVSLLPPPATPGSAPLHSRHLKRIHLAPEILKAVKICAGDALVIGKMPSAADGLADGLQQLDLGETSKAGPQRARFAVGIAWPNFTMSGSVSTIGTSGVEVLEADKVTLIHDGKSKASKDSFFEAYVKEVLVDIRFVALNHFVEVTYNGVVRRLVVASAKGQVVSPEATAAAGSPAPREQTFAVSRTTILSFKAPGSVAATPKSRSPATTAKGGSTGVPFGPGGELPGYEQIGGLENQIEQIREMVEWPLTRPELYTYFGLRPPRGILLYGPPGTGKTLLAFSIARSTRSTLLTINGPSLSSAYHGETEARLREVFAEAKQKSPAIIVIDEVDALAPNREEGGEVERRVVATLLTLMDGLEDKGEPKKGEDGDEDDDDAEPAGPEEQPRVVVIAATNRPNAIDPALRRPGRFDKEIEIGVPDVAARLSILQVLLRQTPHSIPDETLQAVAARTHGFVGADLSSLVHSAGLSAIKRSYSLLSSTSAPSLASMKLLPADLESALLSTRPSAMREVFLETPKVYFRDIGGQEHVKAKLKESVEWPLLHPDAFKRLGVSPPRGVLLYGPPGCSKTLIAKALATEGGLNFIAVKGPEVFNKYVGESERAIREVFRKARAAAPSIVFLDEVDALAPARGSDESSGPTGDRVLMSLLTEMDGIEELNGVIVLAATNRPDVIDPALMRPGRLDRILYVSPPDLEARKQIFRLNFAKMAVHDEVDVEELAQLTEGCSGAECASICQDAALAAMNEDMNTPSVGRKHFVEAARTVRRRITPEVIAEYEDWRDRSGVRSA
ncbi:hypothetical protein Rhopal_000374-T1 [Rhodotorula paludigena]|uniref:AAA+ ATPase domain-containing protein n=1 Tax=Rhodotorula paludigena TaxID=86838 RepID=A0AAV5G4Z8_9BASI|nr:hypothetical protein Rhopal_000374-T1 [Rhodotorula paludigena]